MKIPLSSSASSRTPTRVRTRASHHEHMAESHALDRASAWRAMTLEMPIPSRATISVCVLTIAGLSSMRRMRYRDIESANPSPRTSTWTRRCARNTAPDRGIAAADDDDLLADAELRLHRHRGVKYAGTFELRQVRERRPAVLSAGRNDHRTRTRRAIRRRSDAIRLPIAGQPGRAFRDHDLRAELLGLRVGARPVRCQPGNAGRKLEIVFNPGARSRLAAGRVRFEDETSRPSRRAMHGRRQTRWPRARQSPDRSRASDRSRR